LFFQGTTISDGRGYAPKGVKSWNKDNSDQPPAGLTNGKSFITRVGKDLHFDDNMIAAVESLFENVYDKELVRTRTFKRHAMAAACLLTIGRKGKIGLSVSQMAEYITEESKRKSMSTIAHFLTKLRLKHDVVLPSVSSSDNVTQILQSVSMPKEVIKVAEEIVHCMEDAMITQGRPDRLLAFPAAYFGWKACYYQMKSKVNFQGFCRKYSVSMSQALSIRKREMQSVLKGMVEELPWVTGSHPALSNMDPYIKDVLEYKKSLLLRAISTKASSMTEHNGANKGAVTSEIACGNYMDELDSPTTGVEKADENKESKNHGSVFRMKCKYGKKKKRCSDGSGPADAKCRKIRDTDSDMENELYLGSDDDTDQYIISPEEVAERKKVMKLMEDGSQLTSV